ncbi:ABC transporter ATP-binding protein [Clostridium hydrogeniformans]|uniref:ABC transporter ATP-binding protein n=1 Tax=Clostridium hydrogeniformans TaxID=349933 RepID=UPI000482157E|nr:ABC transporter ATP-binding protein [Clostridium hydrogeniformans]
MENILEVKNLDKAFNDFKLDNVSFQLKKGYIMGFIGPNGAGKSTTIKLIMNLIKRDNGMIKVFGKDNIEDEKAIKEKIGFVYDEVNFYEYLKLKEIKSIVAPFYKSWDDKLFKEYMRNFSLNENKKLKELSKGMKMKFSLALALSHDADLIIMDEPTSGLDPVFRREILDLLQGIIQDENKSIFFSTHITSDLERIADYITFLNKGKVVFSESKDYIMENYAVVKGDNNLLEGDNKNLFIGVDRNSFGFEALTDNKNLVRETLGKKVIIEKPTLDDIMVYMNKR